MSKSKTSPQKLYLAVIVIRLIGPADVTLPNVGEFTVVSIAENCGIFKKFCD